jgi:hypothetical protein
MKCSIDPSSFEGRLACVLTHCSSQARGITISTIIRTVHTIWMARNILRLSSHKISLQAAKAKTVSSIALNGNNSTNSHLFIVSDINLLNSFWVSLSFRCFRNIVPIVWMSPMITWFKVNTDGSWLGMHASCGGVFHDNCITFLGCFASNLGVFGCLRLIYMM